MPFFALRARRATTDPLPSAGRVPFTCKTAVAVTALSIFVSQTALAQDAVPEQVPPADAAVPETAAPVKEPVLPDVEIETAVEPEAEAPAISQVKAAPQAARSKPARKTASKPRKAPPPQLVEPAPAFDPAPAAADVDTASSEGSGEANGPAPVRGGPSGIDGYTAKNTSTATKTDTPIKDIPQSITVVTRQQADDQGSRSLGQALSYVPGVTVAQGEGHRDALTIRGQQTTADFYVNGVRDDVEYYRAHFSDITLALVFGGR